MLLIVWASPFNIPVKGVPAAPIGMNAVGAAAVRLLASMLLFSAYTPLRLVLTACNWARLLISM